MGQSQVSYELAHKMFSYDSETGLLKRTMTVSSRAIRGMTISTINLQGYVVVRFENKLQLVHRLIWLMQTGEWPTLQIDHINGNSRDNRWVNLRHVSRAVNLQNKAAPSGGVYYARRDARWIAECRVDGVRKVLGSSPSRAAAELIYKTWKRNSLPPESTAWNVQ